MMPVIPQALVDAMCQQGYYLGKLRPSGGGFIRFNLAGEKKGKMSGFVKLFPGEDGAIFGDFKSGAQLTWQAKGVQTLTPAERKAHCLKLEAAQRETEAECAKMREAARIKAEKLWAKSGPVDPQHPYLVAKGIRPIGIKQLRQMLVVPVQDADGALHSLQFIGADGSKRFLTGGRKTGCYAVIGEPGDVLCIAEGLATSISAHYAAGYAVALAFDAGNLLLVARAVREKYPNARLIILADNDQFTDGNPGITKATAAARAVGAHLAIPDFTGCDLSGKPTDFNDLSLLRGADAVKQAINAAQAVDVPKSQAQQKVVSEPVENEEVETAGWEKPVLFAKSTPPEISPDILPGVFGEYAAALAEGLQVSPTMPTLLLLSILSLALQRKFVVALNGDNYTEPVCIWVALLAESGERKSAVMKLLLDAVILWEAKRNKAMESEIIEAETLRAISQKRIEKLQADAAKEDSSVRRGELVREIAELREQTPEPKVHAQLFTGDTTVEEMQNLLVKHGGKLAVMATEGGIFAVLAGLYSGGESYLDTALQAYSGDPVRVNRGSRVAIIDRPALTFGICIQPGLIADMQPAVKRKFRSSGLLARFFFGYPASSIGGRDMGKRSVLSPDIANRYRAAVLGLLDIKPTANDAGEEVEHVLTISDQAREVWIAFAQKIENSQADGGRLESLRDWSAKLPGGTLRVAGLFHVAEHGFRKGMEIDSDTMRRAVKLCAGLIPHTSAVFDLVGADSGIEDAKVLWRWIARQGGREVLRSECHKALHGRFSKVERLIASFEILKGRNLVTGPHKAAGPTNKKPIFYRVNPLAAQGQD